MALTLEKLYAEQLRELLAAETRQVPALAALADAAHDEGLGRIFERHLQETREQARRIGQLLEDLGEKTAGGRCELMAGLVRAAEAAPAVESPSARLDAALIGIAQQIEHHEIANYGSVRTYATVLGDDAAAAVLQEILDQETAVEGRLSEAVSKLNARAETAPSAPAALLHERKL